MRQSGSDAADIVVLVVAADDGVSAQTVEILNLYKAIVRGAGSGGISLVVAMNKIDKPGVDVEESRRRIESQLLEHGIVVEGMPYCNENEFGPPVQLIPVSGLTGQGIDDLVEGLMIQAEVMDLRGDEHSRAEGIVMDARVDRGLGNVVDCIIRWGSLSKGDVVVSGTSMGRVRFLKDMSDMPCTRGLPSQPVRIVGFEMLPKAGDSLVCVESEEAANDLISRRLALKASDVDDSSSIEEAELQSAGKHMMQGDWKDTLEEKHGLDTKDNESCIRIPVVVKADADGTLSAILHALLEIGNQSRHNVVIEPVKSGVGPVLASEIKLAKESGATLVCFNVKNEQAIVRMAEDEGVALMSSRVIYSLLDMARSEFAKCLPAQSAEVVHGRAEVHAIYDIGGVSEKVAGLRVLEGKLYRTKAESQGESQFRVIRNGRIISDSELRASSLKHFKEDVEEISRGKECGLSLAGYGDFQVGDVIECFSIKLIKAFV
jgi:translation initiation factor IF-2